MPELKHFRHLFAFHHWATDKIFDALTPVTAVQLDQKWGGSFGTGRALLQHVMGVERLWADRWRRRSGATLPAYPATHGGADFAAEWKRVRPDQQQFLTSVTAEQLGQDLGYVNLKGESKSYPLAHVLIHVVNHGTYHRGQITHLLRDLGLPAPSTDFLYYDVEPR